MADPAHRGVPDPVASHEAPGKKAGLMLYVDARFISPYAMSAFVSLNGKGLPFVMKTVDLGAGENLLPPDLALMLNRLAFLGDDVPQRLASYARPSGSVLPCSSG